MFDQLGLKSLAGSREGVAILVGPNGSGKSNFLRMLADHLGKRSDIAVICNTAYDRFVGLRGITRFSAGRGTSSPQVVIKRSMAGTLDSPDSRYYQINNILEYCGYSPRFGFRLRLTGYVPDDVNREDPRWQEDIESAFHFLRQTKRDEVVWIDPAEPFLAHAHSRDFAAVLRHERLLIREHVIYGIDVCLETRIGKRIDLEKASSGQLSLISSLVFLIAKVSAQPIVLIDEPENSLHPSWQREYVDKLLAALSYRNAKVIIATHSPLIVTGALASNSDIVSVHQVQDSFPEPLGDDGRLASSSGIEELLWKAFEVVTPANHFVSVEILDEISRFERGEVSKDELLGLIGRMDRRSFDPKQQAFFEGVRELVNKVEADGTGPDTAQ